MRVTFVGNYRMPMRFTARRVRFGILYFDDGNQDENQ